MKQYDDGFYDDLTRLNNELVNLQRELAKKNAELEAALRRVKRLEGILPICTLCHRIRDEHEAWQDLANYITEHSDATFSHGICSDCMAKFYPSFNEEDE